MEAIAILKILRSPKFWKVMGVTALVVAIIGLFAATYFSGVQHERDRLTAVHTAAIETIKRAAAEDLAEAQSAARAAEQASRQRIHDIEVQHYEKMQAAEAERDRLLAAVESGELRLRDRFTCPASGSGSVPGTVPGSAGSEPAQAGGLQQADVQFLVRFAHEADEVTRQLQACQAILASDRQKKE